ncbi:MAG TPA: glycosyltransferase [bacterium]|jgi:glycosyltransferase involved in cell wall biosynthesis|nr:glycosyltransferase [bacterium]HOG38144.1 glycosyltransferase [bacterium]
MDKKIKICQVITQTHFGGAQKYICDISNNLGPDFEITIAYGEGNEQELNQYIKTNVPVRFYKLKYLKRNINLFFDKLALWELFFFFKKNKFNVIHLHSSKAGFLASIAGKLAGIKKIIYTAHGWVFKENLNFVKKILYTFLEKFGAKFKDKIICVSQNDYDLALSKKITKKEKLELIYNGFQLTTEFFKTNDARRFLFNQIQIPDNGEKIIGTISNLYKNKGIEYLIESAKILNEKKRNLIFIVIGSGSEEKNLKNLVQKLQIKNFHFLGQINNASRYLKAFEIFTLTSIKEGLPYTLIEALYARIGIVCSDLESLSEIILNGQNGVVFEPKNTTKLVYAIESILNNLEFTKKIKDNNNLTLSKFDFGTFISKIKENYTM